MISKRVFIVVFVPVFLFVVFTATVITFILPEYYTGIARVHAGGDLAAEGDVVRSDAVLKQVADKLNLSAEWGKKYNHGVPLKMEDTIQWLKIRLAIRPEKGGASLIDITCYSEDRDEAPRIANAVADAYQAQKPSGQVEIVDRAKPNNQPAKPNKPLNIAVGMGLGVVAGGALGGLAGWLAGRRSRRPGN